MEKIKRYQNNELNEMINPGNTTVFRRSAKNAAKLGLPGWPQELLCTIYSFSGSCWHQNQVVSKLMLQDESGGYVGRPSCL